MKRNGLTRFVVIISKDYYPRLSRAICSAMQGKSSYQPFANYLRRTGVAADSNAKLCISGPIERRVPIERGRECLGSHEPESVYRGRRDLSSSSRRSSNKSLGAYSGLGDISSYAGLDQVYEQLGHPEFQVPRQLDLPRGVRLYQRSNATGLREVEEKSRDLDE